MAPQQAALFSLVVLTLAHLVLGDYSITGKNKRFFVSDNRLNWNAAKIDCVHRGMRLATIENAESVVSLKEALESRPSDAFWVGGSNEPYSSEFFTWSAHNYPTGFSITQWAPNEPKHADQVRCVEVRPGDRLWNSEACSKRSKYVCVARL